MNEPKNQLVEHVFRHEYGKIISFLTHKFGPSYLEVIEDGVQEALLKAMQLWGYSEPPLNPTAWLLRVANNKIVDELRRNQKGEDKKKEWSYVDNSPSNQTEIYLNDRIHDSQLKMIFACCHPSLSKDYQIILSLKLIGGFGNGEIASALLKKEETVAKSFTRAKKQLKRTVKTLDIPIEIGLRSRLKVVLKVIYLLFSEGYAPNSGAMVLKKDICMEAIRLALLLEENKYCKHPDVQALIALMCFHTSRFEARVGENKELIDLEHQDRTQYERNLIAIGIEHLERASVGVQSPSNYHTEAAISYYHCTAKSFGDTDWKSILHLYNLQLQKQYSPIVFLNSIIPYHKVHGAKAAMQLFIEFEKSPYCIKNRLFHAIKAELLVDLKEVDEAKKALKKAIDLTKNTLEKRHFEKKLGSL